MVQNGYVLTLTDNQADEMPEDCVGELKTAEKSSSHKLKIRNFILGKSSLIFSLIRMVYGDVVEDLDRQNSRNIQCY